MTDPTANPWLLAEATWPTVQAYDWQLAVLPWGATEPHNLHLPYGTDTVQAEAVAARAAAAAWEAGARVAVLPAVPFGVQTGQLDLTLTLNMNPSTQAALIGDLADSLEGQGIQKLVVLNGHGGNDFKAIIRELQPSIDLFLCAVDWYRCVDARAFFDEPGDHAGELETSVMMHLGAPGVRPLEEAGSGQAREWRIRALLEGWAWAPRPWTEVTGDTGVGDPAAATAQRGGAFVEAAVAKLGELFVELAEADLGDLFR